MITALRYAEITGDTDSYATDVTARIEEAVEMLEDYLDRPLESDERTEAMRPDRHGRLWPKATPITDGGDYEIDGLALLSASPFAIGFIGSEVTVEVTYTGGWTADTLPSCIERDLAFAAYRLLHPPTLGSSEFPDGATSVRLGDAAVTFGPGGAGVVAGDTDSWWSRRTRAYRYASVHTGPPPLVAS
jgi:hypothetical protein